jgi:hypothetical protein
VGASTWRWRQAAVTGAEGTSPAAFRAVDPDVQRDRGGVGPQIGEDLTQRRLGQQGARAFQPPVQIVKPVRPGDKVGEYRQADIVPVRYDASDHSTTAVDVPALEAEFQRSRAKGEAERASRIARSEAKLAGAAAEPSGSRPPMAQDITASGGTAAAVEFLKSAMQEISAAGTARDSVEERLAKLRRLRDGGVLSTEEYEAQRQRILQSM